jgi:O-antigen/teichoic acid export membrane protein
MARDPSATENSNDRGDVGALRKLGAFAVSTLLATGGLFVLRLVKNVLFTRLLGPAGRGVYGLVTTIPDLVVSVGNLGFGLGSIYLIAQKRAPLKKILGNAIVFLFFHGILLVIAGSILLANKGFLIGQSDQIVEFRVVIIISVWLILAYHLGMDILTGIKDIHFMNGLRLLYSALPIMLMLIFWYFFQNAVWAGVGAWVLTVLIVVLATGYRLFKLFPGKPEMSRPLLREALSFGLRGNVSMFANAVVRRVDVLFIAYYHGAEAVGFYAVGVSVAEILLAVPEAVALPFLPIRLEMKQGESGSFSAFTIKYVLLFMVVACVFTAVFSKWIIFILFGKTFLQSTASLLWLLPGIIALSLYQFLKADIYSLNRPGLISWVSVLTMGCNLILNYLTIPAYGIAGAAASSSVSYLLSTVILMVFFLKKSGQKPFEVLILKRADISLLIRHIRSVIRSRGGKKDTHE